MEFKQGDFIVSLENTLNREAGQIFRVPKTHEGKEMFVYFQIKSNRLKDRTFASNRTFRLAKKEEIEFFKEENSFDVNVRDLGKSFDKNTKYKAGETIIVKDTLTSGFHFGTYNYPEGIDYIRGEKLTIKRVTKRGEYIIREKPIKLKDNLIDYKVEQEKFPTHGWCEDPSEKLVDYICKKFNSNKKIIVGKKGFAWKSESYKIYNKSYPGSVWKIENGSGYTKYNSIELEKLIPKINGHKGTFHYDVPVYTKDIDLGGDLKDSLINKENRIKIDYLDPTDYSYSNSDSYVASMLAFQSVGKSLRKKDRFTQQEPVLIKTKKSKKKLFIC